MRQQSTQKRLACWCDGPVNRSCHGIWVDSHSVFFFNDTATTEIYTLSLHDALPISSVILSCRPAIRSASMPAWPSVRPHKRSRRSEEHTSELQSLAYLVCRLLLEKKKKKKNNNQSKHKKNKKQKKK